MATITWKNIAGSVGSYPAGTTVSIQFFAESSDISSVISYKLLSGDLPIGTKADPFNITLPGYLVGTVATVYDQTTYYFTVRAYDQYGNIRDRTFNITTTIAQSPKLLSPTGTLLSVYDSTWTDYQIDYYNPVSENVITTTVTSGSFPPGLYLTSDGKIKGYAKPPVLGSGTPINKTYTFTVQLSSLLGVDSVSYTIEVLNKRLISPAHSRMPAIVNNKPLQPISPNDPYYGFYLDSYTLPTIRANEYFTFKIIGHDFEGDMLIYSFSSLPNGLSADPTTGWITGMITMTDTRISEYQFTVSVAKQNFPLVSTPITTYKLVVMNNVENDIIWVSPEDLGIIYNNTICELNIQAVSSRPLNYILVDGQLPSNLSIGINGSISGRVAYQSANSILPNGSEAEFTFTVVAYAASFSTVRLTKTFKLTVKQYFTDPVETVYFKASPSLSGRIALNSLLTDTTIIPTEYLYRPDDIYFGKSSGVKIVQAYGIPASTLTTYLNAIQKNHYRRNVGLGELKTAIARNDQGDIIYEVVYSEIVDEYVNNFGVSIPEEIKWHVPISKNLGPWTVNNTHIFASYSFNGKYFTSLSPGTFDKLYPASIDNMRSVLISNLGQDIDSKLLPRWMTSQQIDGNTIGFIKCWVLCYTLPGYSTVVKESIEKNWDYSLTDIDCTFDRYYVDKSSTYNWNLDLLIPSWIEIPSEVPNPTNPESHDLVVLFPNKTILPEKTS